MASLVITRSAINLFVVALVLTLASFRNNAQAQQECAQGIVRLPGDVNGQITVCPAIGSYAPNVAKQLTALEKAVSSQQTEVSELVRLIRDLNKVGVGLVLKQQSELLSNVLTRLGDPQALTSERLQSRTSTLSTHFEDVSGQISSVMRNPQTANQAATGLRGSIGDALSRLDFETVTDQLNMISAQLKIIDGKVDKVDQTTQKTLSTVEEMKREQERVRDKQAVQQAEMEKQYQEQLQKNEQTRKDTAEAALNDPMRFVRVSLMAFSVGGSWKLHVLLMRHGEPLSASKLEVVYNGATNLNRVSFPLTSLLNERQSPEVQVDTLSDRVTLCFSAFDPRLSARRMWVGDFQAEQHQSSVLIEARYNLISKPSLSLDSGGACSPGTSLRGGELLSATKGSQGPYSNYGINLVLNAYQAQGNGPWHLIVAGGGSLVENPTLEVLLFGVAGRRSTLVRMNVPKVINSLFKGQEVAIPEPGQQAVVCFSATRQGSEKRMVMRQTYDLQRRLGVNIIDFQTSSQPTFTEDTGSPCH